MRARGTGRGATIAAAATVGMLLRLALIAASPAAGMRGGDLPVYHGTALALAEGEAWLDTGEFGYRPPLFFVYLSAVYTLAPAPAPYWIGQLATATLLIPILLLYAHLAFRLALTARAFAWLVWLRATLPTFVVADVQILSEPLFEALLLSLFTLAVVASREGLTVFRASLLGLNAAALLLTREVGVAFVVGLASAASIAAFRARRPLRGAPFALLACLAMAAALAPWLARNQVVNGQPFPLTTTGGVNFHIGHNPDATGTWGPILDPAHQPPADLEPATPAWSRWHRERAFAYIAAEPWQALARTYWKLAYLVFPRAERQEIIADRNFPGLPDPLPWAALPRSS